MNNGSIGSELAECNFFWRLFRSFQLFKKMNQLLESLSHKICRSTHAHWLHHLPRCVERLTPLAWMFLTNSRLVGDSLFFCFSDIFCQFRSFERAKCISCTDYFRFVYHNNRKRFSLWSPPLQILRGHHFFMARFLYNAFLYCWMVYAFFAYGLKRHDVRLFLRG